MPSNPANRDMEVPSRGGKVSARENPVYCSRVVNNDCWKLSKKLPAAVQNLLSNCANAFSRSHCWRAFSLDERKASHPEEIFFTEGMSRSHSLALRALWFHHKLRPGRKLYSRLLRANFLRSG